MFQCNVLLFKNGVFLIISKLLYDIPYTKEIVPPKICIVWKNPLEVMSKNMGLRFYKSQKQPPKVFCKKRCSKKFCKIQRITHVTESLFNKVAGLRPVTLLKKRLCRRCFAVNFSIFLRTSFLQNTSGWLLLKSFCIFTKRSN